MRKQPIKKRVKKQFRTFLVSLTNRINKVRYNGVLFLLSRDIHQVFGMQEYLSLHEMQKFNLSPSIYSDLKMTIYDKVVTLTITTTRPGLVVGKGGSNIKAMEETLTDHCKELLDRYDLQKIVVNITESNALREFLKKY